MSLRAWGVAKEVGTARRVVARHTRPRLLSVATLVAVMLAIAAVAVVPLVAVGPTAVAQETYGFFAVFPFGPTEFEPRDMWGAKWAPDSEVLIEIDGFSMTAGTDGDGYFELSGIPFDIKPGDVVTVSQGARVKTHVVIDLRVTRVDSVSDRVSGVGAPNLPTWVAVFGDDPEGAQQRTRNVLSDSAGAWTADFSVPDADGTPAFDIRPGVGIHVAVEQTDDDWDMTAIRYLSEEVATTSSTTSAATTPSTTSPATTPSTTSPAATASTTSPATTPSSAARPPATALATHWTEVPFPGGYLAESVVQDSQGNIWALGFDKPSRGVSGGLLVLKKGGLAWEDGSAGLEGNWGYVFAYQSLLSLGDKLFLTTAEAGFYSRSAGDERWHLVILQNEPAISSLSEWAGYVWSGRSWDVGGCRLDPVTETWESVNAGLPGDDTGYPRWWNPTGTRTYLYVGFTVDSLEAGDPDFAGVGVWRLKKGSSTWEDTGLRVRPLESDMQLPGWANRADSASCT